MTIGKCPIYVFLFLALGTAVPRLEAEVKLLPGQARASIKHHAGSMGVYPVYHEWLPASANSSVGKQWVSSLDVFLAKLKDPRTIVVHIAGRRFLFQKEQSGQFAALSRNAGRLEYTDDSYLYTLKTGAILRFATDGKLNAILHQDGEKTVVFNDSEGRLKGWITGKRQGGVVRRNRNGTIVAIRFPSGWMQYGYEDGRLATISGERGQLWAYTYDDMDRPVSVFEPRQSWTLAYSPEGKLLSIRNSAGETRSIEYSDRGESRFVYVWHSNGTITKYTINPDSVRIEEGPINQGPLTITKIDRKTGRKTIRHRDGTTALFTPPANGRFVAAVLRPGTLPTRSVISAEGRMLESRRGATVFRDIMCSPGSSIPDALSLQDGVVRDTEGRIIKLVSGGKETATYKYDRNGNLSRTTLPGGAAMSFKYDDKGRMVQYTDVYRAVTRWKYDDAKRLAEGILPNGETEIRRYDADNRLVALEYPLGRVLHYGYDSDGNFFGVRQGNFDIQFWDPAVDGKTSVYESLLFGNWTFRDLAEGWVKLRIDPLGTQVLFDLNDAGGLDNVRKLNETVLAAYEYDNAGNMTGARTDAVTLRMTSDKYGRLVSMHDRPAGISVNLAYNSVGTVSRLEDSDGHSIDFLLNESRQISEARSSLAGTFKLTYGILGLPESLSRPNGVTTHWTYDAGGRITGCRHVLPRGRELFVKYQRDRMGNVIQKDASDSGTTSFTYDGLSQLAGFVSGGARTDISYDAWGNLTRLGARIFRYVAPAILHEADGASVQCDKAGRIARIEGPVVKYAFDYDWDHRLARLSGPDSSTHLWGYGPFGRPVTFADSEGRSTRYTYALGRLYSAKPEGVGNGRRYIMLPGTGECLAIVREDGRIDYPLSDPMRTITHLTDAKGRLFASRGFAVLGTPEGRDEMKIELGYCGGLSFLAGKALYLNGRMYWVPLARALAAPAISPGDTVLREDNPVSFLSANPFTAVR